MSGATISYCSHKPLTPEPIATLSIPAYRQPKRSPSLLVYKRPSNPNQLTSLLLSLCSRCNLSLSSLSPFTISLMPPPSLVSIRARQPMVDPIGRSSRACRSSGEDPFPSWSSPSSPQPHPRCHCHWHPQPHPLHRCLICRKGTGEASVDLVRRGPRGDRQSKQVEMFLVD
jgi:hypothetical protein